MKIIYSSIPDEGISALRTSVKNTLTDICDKGYNLHDKFYNKRSEADFHSHLPHKQQISYCSDLHL